MDETTRLQHRDSIHGGNFWSERTFLEKILIILLAIVVGVGVALSIALAAYRKEYVHIVAKIHEDICETPECVTSAAYLIDSMDTSIEPCEDFFTFACGGYLNKTFLLGDRVTRFSKLSVKLLLRIKVLLEETYHEDDPVHWKKTKEFYEKCMNLNQRQQLEGEPLLKDLNELGKCPLLEGKGGGEEQWDSEKFSWSDTLKKMFDLGYDKDVLIKIDVDLDLKNSTQTILVVDQPTLGMPRILYLLDYPYDYGLTAYETFILKCFLMLNPTLSVHEIKKQIGDAMDIERRLAKASLSSSEKKKFIQLYENHTMNYKEFREKYEGIPWDALFKSFLPKDVTVTDDDVIWVPVPSAVSEFQKTVQGNDSDSKRKLANYMMYRVVVQAAIDLSHRFSLASYDFENTLNGKPYSYPEPWQDCVATTRKFFYYSLSSMYARRYFKEETKNNVSSVELSIREMLEQQIKDADWIDDKTQDRALNKAEKIEGTIGYPEDLVNDTVLNDFFEKFQVDKDHYANVREAYKFYAVQDMEGLHEKYDKRSWMAAGDLLVANAFYTPIRNAIVIPVGVLQEETYNAEKPNYLNFGSLGMLLGHELTHGFDMTGNQFNEKGDLEFWWTQETYYKIVNRSKCFVQQYDGYKVPVLNQTLNGTLTLNENMADTGGVYTAYKAYQRWVEKNGKEKLLPGLPYTPNQLFWLSFASVWCYKDTPDYLRYSIMHDVHSPPRYRVKGVLSNLKEFSTDFNCEKGSTMNPETKCRLWT